jgi:hypothetical protein
LAEEISEPSRNELMVNCPGRDKRMRIAALMTALTILTAGVATADVVRHSVIPESYRGTWTAGAGTEPAGAVIVLSADAYVGPGEVCRVGWVSQTAGAQGSIYAAHLRCSAPGEGTGNKTVANLIIWPKDTDHIAIGAEFTHLKIFHRCDSGCVARADKLRSDDMNSDASRTQSANGYETGNGK